MNHIQHFIDQGFEPPPLPEGWRDSSYVNDACPSYERGLLHVWIDHPDADQREWGPCHRFAVLRMTADPEHGPQLDEAAAVLMESDDWSAVVEYVNGCTEHE